MAIVNLRQASAHLGFRTTTTLRRLLQAGELSAYVRSGPDLRATYLDVAPKGSANAAAARSNPYGVPWELAAMGCGLRELAEAEWELD